MFVWNTSDLSAFNISTYWRNIVGKVMAVSVFKLYTKKVPNWIKPDGTKFLRYVFIYTNILQLTWHPTEENWLTFGTSDGHIGLIELGANKLPTIFRLHHRKAVYKICWAPPLLKNGMLVRDSISVLPENLCYIPWNDKVKEYSRQVVTSATVNLGKFPIK